LQIFVSLQDVRNGIEALEWIDRLGNDSCAFEIPLRLRTDACNDNNNNNSCSTQEKLSVHLPIHSMITRCNCCSTSSVDWALCRRLRSKLLKGSMTGPVLLRNVVLSSSTML
jgi:hypothetical protein